MNYCVLQRKELKESQNRAVGSRPFGFVSGWLVSCLALCRAPIANDLAGEAQLFDVILGENELPEQSVLEGTMLEARGAWYKGPGEKKLTAEVILRRRSNETVFKKSITAGPNVWTRASYADENELWSAGALADRIVKEIRNSLKK